MRRPPQLLKTVNAGLAALGLVATGIVAALVTTGLLEGISGVPSWAATVAGAALFIGALGLAGQITTELDPNRPYVAAGVTAGIVLAIGYAAATASERATGEGLEHETVFILAGGLFTMLAVSTLVARRRQRGEHAQSITTSS